MAIHHYLQDYPASTRAVDATGILSYSDITYMLQKNGLAIMAVNGRTRVLEPQLFGTKTVIYDDFGAIAYDYLVSSKLDWNAKPVINTQTGKEVLGIVIRHHELTEEIRVQMHGLYSSMHRRLGGGYLGKVPRGSIVRTKTQVQVGDTETLLNPTYMKLEDHQINKIARINVKARTGQQHFDGGVMINGAVFYLGQKDYFEANTFGHSYLSSVGMHEGVPDFLTRQCKMLTQESDRYKVRGKGNEYGGHEMLCTYVDGLMGMGYSHLPIGDNDEHTIWRHRETRELQA